MQIERKFTTDATGAYGALAFTTTTSEIRNPDGKVVFRNDAVEVPMRLEPRWPLTFWHRNTSARQVCPRF